MERNPWSDVSPMCTVEGERENVQDNGVTSDALWHGGGSSHEGARDKVAEVRMLQFTLGKTRMDRLRNERIRSTLKVGKLDGKLRETRPR